WKWLFDKKMTLNLEKTKKLLDEAIQLNPEYSKIYLYYGELFLLKDTSKAIEYLTKSFKLESDNPSTIKSLILAVQFSGSDRNFKELILELEGLNSKLLQLSPSSIDGYEALKNVSFQHRDFKGCIKYGKKIINLKPNDFLGYFNLGFFYRIIENYNLAIKYFEIGLKLHNIREKYDSYVLPYDEVHIWLAEAFEKIGEIKKALKIYEKFKMKFPNGKPFLPQSALDWRIHKIKSSIKDKEL
ncbi:MAG: tetratricopeptide repeat protein, partial [Candidatus Thorarchaeota archaeon]